MITHTTCHSGKEIHRKTGAFCLRGAPLLAGVDHD